MKLPRKFLDTATLSNLRVGEAAYTTPWAMWVDSDMECWLHPEYTAAKRAGGTVRMLVERREDGYHVWPPSDERYQPSERQPFIGGNGAKFIPVAKVHE